MYFQRALKSIDSRSTNKVTHLLLIEGIPAFPTLSSQGEQCKKISNNSTDPHCQQSDSRDPIVKQNEEVIVILVVFVAIIAHILL